MRDASAARALDGTGSLEAGAQPAGPVSALYSGLVVHQRFSPRRHRLRYRHYALWLDLDELPSLDGRLRCFSLNRFNLFSLHERDHGDGRERGLRDWVDEQLAQAGLPTGGAVRLLAMPRVLGHVFNPLSLYFCHEPGGALRAVLYEVDNTFGERHAYLIEVEPGCRDGQRLRQRCAKRFHVSPFLDMALEYRFDIEPPAPQRESLRVGVADHRTNQGADDEASEPVLTATMAMRRHALDDRALLRVFATHPLLTLKVVTAIHWEALRLWMKGVPLFDRPPAPPRSLTVVRCTSVDGVGAEIERAAGPASARSTHPPAGSAPVRPAHRSHLAAGS